MYQNNIFSQFKHDNIVAFYGVSFEQQPRYIILEYLEGGDLKNFLRENRPKFSQVKILNQFFNSKIFSM